MALAGAASKANIYTVSPNGGDFATLTAAKRLAVSGDTIIVEPGTYNELDLLKDGVNWFFMPGAIVAARVTAGSQRRAIFDDKGAAVVCDIGGRGTFQLLCNIDDALDASPAKSVSSLSRSGVLATANCTAHGFATGDIVLFAGCTGGNAAAYNIYTMVTVVTANQFTFAIATGADSAAGTIVATKLDFTNGVAAAVFLRNSGSKVTMSANKVEGYLDGDNAVLSLLNGRFSLTCEELNCLPDPIPAAGSGGKLVYAVACQFNLKARRMYCNAGNPGYIVRCYDQLGAALSMYIEADYMEGGGPCLGTESAIGATSDNYRLFGKMKEIRCTGFAINGACVDTLGGGQVAVDAERMLGFTNVLFNSGGIMRARAHVYEITGAGTEVFNNASGTLNVVGGRATIANGKGVVHSGGLTKISGVWIDSSATNAAGNVAANASAAGLQLSSCTLLSGAAAASVGAGGQTVQCFPPCIGKIAATATIQGTLTIDATLT